MEKDTVHVSLQFDQLNDQLRQLRRLATTKFLVETDRVIQLMTRCTGTVNVAIIILNNGVDIEKDIKIADENVTAAVKRRESV
ncbi:hypothetical protein EVAR_68078_1 [Eumeta japonica]|uniref:Uncharacterized protein n=1 Tax=Eumeta variegata TaxID=151549 RepID=A0A4C1ZQZ1_EUMVA|nr:hypothetical protein EVAR_68078_1 [Eumeta japonica]